MSTFEDQLREELEKLKKKKQKTATTQKTDTTKKTDTNNSRTSTFEDQLRVELESLKKRGRNTGKDTGQYEDHSVVTSEDIAPVAEKKTYSGKFGSTTEELVPVVKKTTHIDGYTAEDYVSVRQQGGGTVKSGFTKFEDPAPTISLEDLKAKRDSATDRGEKLEYTKLYNQKALAQYSEIFATTQMDGQNHSVLEEIYILAGMKSGKEKDKRKEAVLAKMEELGLDSTYYSHFAGDGEFDWNTFGSWLGSSAMAGLNSFNKGLADTADVLLGNPLKALGWENNPISQVADYYGDLYNSYNYDRHLYAEKLGGGAWDFAGDAVEGTTGAVPNAILALMTAGGSTVATTSTLTSQAAYNAGNVLTKAGLTTSAMMKNPQYWLSFSRTLGSDYKEAKEMGASDTAAAFGSVLSSAINAGIEIGPDGGSGIQGLPNAIKQGGKPLWEFVESSLEEGGEEGLQKFVSEIVAKTVYGSDEQILNPHDYAKEMTLGTISGMALGGGQIATQGVVNAVGEYKKNKLTDTEKTVVDKIVEQLIAEEEKATVKQIDKPTLYGSVEEYEAAQKGKPLTNKRKAEIKAEVMQDLEKGYISTETIEEVLGGENYTAYQDIVKQDNEALAELAELYEGDELKQKAEEFIKNSKRGELAKTLSDSVYDMVKDTRLGESYRDRARRGQKFEADVNQYDEKQRVTIQRAIDSGVLNNTNRTHDMVDFIARVSADIGVLFDFTNNAKLKDSIFAVNGKTVDGYITKDGITINVNSPRYINTIVGHEITHAFEGTKQYEVLEKALFEYAKEKGTYKDVLKDVYELYHGEEGYEGYEGLKKIKKEAVANLVGDYLFTDKNFINHLSAKHQNIFQKAWNEIKYMVKIARAGSDEAKKLLEVQKAFEDAYRNGGKTVAETKRSLSKDSDGKQLTNEQIEYFKDSKVVDENGSLKVMYHGTSRGGHNVFDPWGKSNYGLFGTGSYFTDSKSIAESYTEKGKGTNPQIYETYLNITNPLDMDAPANPTEWAEAFDEVDFPESGTNEDFYRAVEEYYADQYMAKWEVAEIIRDSIQFGMGYDGLTHIGGGRVNPNGERHRVYIAFEPEQIKRIDNVKPTTDPDIRYSLSDSKKLKDVGLDYDAKNETVSYSMSSLEDAFDYNKSEADYLASRLEYETALAKSIAEDKENVTKEEMDKAKRYLDSLFLIHDMIAMDRDRLDYEAAVGKSAWVSNAEYGGSIDFSTLCAKRRLFTGTFDAIQNELPDTVLDENDFLQIRNMLLEKELESPCSMCYVEGSRAKHGVYVAKFLKEYKQTNPAWIPQIADFTSTTRLEQTRINHPEAYEKYVEAMNKLSQRKPKEASVRTDYRGEILRDFKDTSTVAEKNKNGGVRFNSFSDFEIIHAIDCMQVLTDMARVGLNGQAYTKVKEFAEAFGNTGLKINLSLVAKDVDANGKLIMDETNGMKYDEAMDLRNRYSENVGTVIVVFNEAQLRAALADSTIDYVLPFHRSQWKKSQYTMMGLPTQTKDFTNYQNDRIKNPNTGRDVKLSKIKHISEYTNDITGETFEIKDNIMPNQYWDFNLDGRGNAQRYLDYINANGMTPKFNFLLDKVDGKWVLPEGAVGDGYFKVLIDFKMYDNDGWGSPQNPVVPEFNMPFIQQMLADYKGGHQAFPVAHDVVSEFVEGKKSGKFSLSNDDTIPTKQGNWHISGKDVAYEDIAPTADKKTAVPVVAENATTEELFPDDLAPVQQELENLIAQQADIRGALEAAVAIGDTNTMSMLTKEYEDVTARIRELEAQESERLDSIGDADAPPEMDTQHPIQSNGETVDNPFEDRDWYKVGNQKVKAYMYENPEVKQFFQDEALALMSELRDTTKGEKFYSEEAFIRGGNEEAWTGVKRHTSKSIEMLLDSWGMSYADIEKGLNAIIEDNGAENIAAAKKIEFMLNDRLLNGYSDFYSNGFVPPNQEYINLLEEKQINEYSKEAFDSFMETADQYAPADDIAPVAPAKPAKEEYVPITPNRNAVGAAPYGFDPVTQLQYEYGTIPEGEHPVRDDSLPKSTTGKDKVSLTARTVKGAEVTPDGLVDLLDKETVGGRFSYIPIKNSDTVQKAYNKIVKNGWEEAMGEWSARVHRGEVSAELTATGALLLNNAAKAGDRKAWLSILSDYQIMGTNAGQAVQAMRILKTLNPDDSLYMIERSVEKMVEDMKLGVEIVIDKNLKRDYLNAQTNAEKDAARKALAEDIARQIPSTAMDKWTALRYLNMLGNFRTQVRNILGNTGMSVTSRLKNEVATVIEWIAEKASGGKFHRTKSLFVGKDLLKASKNDFANVEHIALNGGKFNDSKAANTQFAQEVQDARTIFRFAPLEKYRRGTNWLMDKGDLVFSKSSYGRALAGYLKANGIKETDFSKIDQKTLDEARAYAVEEAQETTFRDNNWLSDWVSKVGRRKDTPKIGRLVSEGVMPFRKTPANILYRAEEYSPLGIVNTTVKAIQLAKGAENVTGADVVNSLAKTLTGTGLFALGIWLNNSGMLSGGPDDDDDKEWFESQYGWQNYSLQIGDYNFTIDFLSPSAMPLLMGAQLNELRQSGGVELKDLETALLSIADPMIEMSMLQGVNDTLDNIRYAESNMGQFLVNASVSYLTQGLTNSFLGQLERSFEGQRMSTYVDKDSGTPAWLQKALGKASAKTPGWDYQQIPYVDAWGETEDIAPLPAFMENTLSPSYISEGISDYVYKELNRLNDAQSDINVYPQTPSKTVTFDDANGKRHENYNLSAEEYVKLAQIQGTTQKKLVEDILSADIYSELTDKEKSKAVQLAYQYAREYGRQQVLGADGFSAKWMAEAGDDIVDAIIAHTSEERTFAFEYPEKYEIAKAVGGYKAYKTYKNGMKDMKLAEKVEYVASLNLTNEQKNILINGETDRKEPIDLTGYENYSSFDEFEYAQKDPEMRTVAKAVSDDFSTFYGYHTEISEIKANNDSSSGIRDKDLVTEYIFSLDIDYGQQIILYRSLYSSNADKEKYNADIVDYLNSRDDISYSEMVTILKKLGFTVNGNNVTW